MDITIPADHSEGPIAVGLDGRLTIKKAPPGVVGWLLKLHDEVRSAHTHTEALADIARASATGVMPSEHDRMIWRQTGSWPA